MYKRILNNETYRVGDKIVNIKITKNQLIRFFIVFLLILFKYIEVWSYLFTKEFFKSKVIVGIIATLLLIVFRDVKIKTGNLNKIAILGVLCLAITLISHSIDYLVFFALVIIYFQIENGEKEFVYHYIVSTAILFALTIFLSLVGILPSFSIDRVVNGETITRFNLGFLGANTLFMFFYPIVISFLYLKYNVTKTRKICYGFVILIISWIFYKYTNCRTGMLCVCFAVLLYWQKIIFNTKLIRFVLRYYFLIFLMISILCALKFNAYNNYLNILSSGRFNFWYFYIKNIKYTIIGMQPIQGIPLDNIYLNNFYIYGLISYIITLIFSIMPYKNKKISNEFYFITLAFGIYGFFENNIVYVYNFLMFFQFYYFINCGKVWKEDE
jgi:membrane protein